MYQNSTIPLSSKREITFRIVFARLTCFERWDGVAIWSIICSILAMIFQFFAGSKHTSPLYSWKKNQDSLYENSTIPLSSKWEITFRIVFARLTCFERWDGVAIWSIICSILAMIFKLFAGSKHTSPLYSWEKNQHSLYENSTIPLSSKWEITFRIVFARLTCFERWDGVAIWSIICSILAMIFKLFAGSKHTSPLYSWEKNQLSCTKTQLSLCHQNERLPFVLSLLGSLVLRDGME